MIEQMSWSTGAIETAVLRTKAELPVSPHFAPINHRQWLVPIGRGGDSTETNLPQILTGDLGRWGCGVEHLILELDLAAGYYEFSFSFWEPLYRAIKEGPNNPWVMPRAGKINWPGTLDGPFLREWLAETMDQLDSEDPRSRLQFNTVDQYLNQAGEAYIRIIIDDADHLPVVVAHPLYTRQPENIFHARTERFRFVCTEDGRHRIILAAAQVHYQASASGVHDRVATKALLPLKYEVKSFHPADCSQGGRTLTGQMYLDAWGWEGPISYQRKEHTGAHEEATPAYIHEKVLQESFRWGANLMEFYIPDSKKKMATPMQWDEDDPIPGGDRYRRHPCTQWSREMLISVSRQAHELGMILLWYTHCPYTGNFWDAENEWLFNLAELISRDYADILGMGWRDSIDGFEQESAGSFCSPDPANQLKRKWKYHPGMFQAETYEPNQQRLAAAETPAMLLVPTNSHQFMKDNFRPAKWGDASIAGEYGHQYLIYQGDARGTGYRGQSLERRPRTRPDWVLQQCNDWFRERIVDRNYHSSGIWWLGEPADVSPSWMRRYVYGISQDPIKAAVATKLESLGRDGEMARSRPHKFPNFLHPRYQQDARNSFIQQNHLRLYLRPDSDDTELVVDPQGLAWYDTASLSTTALKPCLQTVIREGGTQLFDEFSSVITFVETAGHRAVLRQTASMAYPYLGMEISERREITADSDTPYLKINLRRKVDGPDEKRIGDTHGWKKIGTRFGCRGYDILEIGDRLETLGAESETVPEVLILRDSKRIVPALFVLVTAAAELAGYEWVSGEELILWCHRETAELDLVIGVVDRGYSVPALPALKTFLGMADRELQLGEGGAATLAPRTELAGVEVVRISDPDGRPYFVREQGWWLFRGAEPALDQPLDYLKVYTAGDDEMIIHRFGFLDGVVRPGWGCQYSLAVRDIAADSSTAGCTARVMTVTPLIFAPRLEFARSIQSVRLNGKSWFYFDDTVVYLPNRLGDSRLEVEFGETVVPHLVASFASVVECRCEDGLLTFQAENPPWVKAIIPALHYHAAIRTPGKSVKNIRNGKLLRQDANGAVITFKPGTVGVELG